MSLHLPLAWAQASSAGIFPVAWRQTGSDALRGWEMASPVAGVRSVAVSGAGWGQPQKAVHEHELGVHIGIALGADSFG